MRNGGAGELSVTTGMRPREFSCCSTSRWDGRGGTPRLLM
ncbi:hypothetical protein T261_01684 [Streptomyces lydicus]|nr:hypothetical protein T261_01684 [Streptomyces lydicus]